jgi:putative transcriptional regulator
MTASEIKQIRRDLGETVSTFAETIGVTRQTIHNWEGGRTQPTGPAWRLLITIRNHGK